MIDRIHRLSRAGLRKWGNMRQIVPEPGRCWGPRGWKYAR